MGEELEAVDNYIYILNVRFAGDIHFSKEVDESLENVRMPSMILQPVVLFVTDSLLKCCSFIIAELNNISLRSCHSRHRRFFLL